MPVNTCLEIVVLKLPQTFKKRISSIIIWVILSMFPDHIDVRSNIWSMKNVESYRHIPRDATLGGDSAWPLLPGSPATPPGQGGFSPPALALSLVSFHCYGSKPHKILQ